MVRTIGRRQSFRGLRPGGLDSGEFWPNKSCNAWNIMELGYSTSQMLSGHNLHLHFRPYLEVFEHYVYHIWIYLACRCGTTKKQENSWNLHSVLTSDQFVGAMSCNRNFRLQPCLRWYLQYLVTYLYNISLDTHILTRILILFVYTHIYIVYLENRLIVCENNGYSIYYWHNYLYFLIKRVYRWIYTYHLHIIMRLLLYA